MNSVPRDLHGSSFELPPGFALRAQNPPEVYSRLRVFLSGKEFARTPVAPLTARGASFLVLRSALVSFSYGAATGGLCALHLNPAAA